MYEIALGWDPAPEVDRLLFIAGSLGLTVNSAIELGCGAGRLLAELANRKVQVMGLELSPEMAELARRRSAAPIVVGDMSDFCFGRTFDLIYTSANTIRHIVNSGNIATMWRSIHRHLNTGGLFVADLELGKAHQADKIGKSDHWTLSRADKSVHVTWSVLDVRCDDSRAKIRWTFEMRDATGRREWSEEFDLRTDDGPAFVAPAIAAGLSFAEMYEIRDPYLIPTDPERASGRMLAVFVRPAASS